jgi:hypothetical protein
MLVFKMKIFYLLCSAIMKMFCSIVILYVVYTSGNPSNGFNFIVVGLTLIWAFYPMYEHIIEIKQLNKKLKGRKK